MRILVVNPPIYDFTAYDFWLRPYGALRVAGRMRHAGMIEAFDFLVSKERDAWGRGRFPELVVPKPAAYADIPRRFRRFGRPREEFRAFLRGRTFDVVLVQTVMTYWYLGVREVIEDVRALQPEAKIVLGGVYARLCAAHAQTLGADLVADELDKLWNFLGLSPRADAPCWELVDHEVGVIKITEGCPFRCTYCSVPQVYPQFIARPTGECIDELAHLVRLGARHVAFYDDALLHRTDRILIPFLEAVLARGWRLNFHTPNALNARFVTPEIARLMVRAGFKTFYLGFESGAYEWQKKTGGKVYSEEFADAVRHLREAGAESITAYLIIGHPSGNDQDIESSMRFASEQGAKVMLSEFAPIPGTPDGERCREWTDLDEPLNHNKTAYTYRRLGNRVNELKQLARL
jgi:pyruvate-formate lyase-activating enzyme